MLRQCKGRQRLTTATAFEPAPALRLLAVPLVPITAWSSSHVPRPLNHTAPAAGNRGANQTLPRLFRRRPSFGGKANRNNCGAIYSISVPCMQERHLSAPKSCELLTRAWHAVSGLQPSTCDHARHTYVGIGGEGNDLGITCMPTQRDGVT